MGRLFSAFILPMEKKIKNLKISVESHEKIKWKNTKLIQNVKLKKTFMVNHKWGFPFGFGCGGTS